LDYKANQIFCLRESILLAVFKEGGVVFDLESRVCHAINHSGAQILNLLDGRKNMSDITGALAESVQESIDVIQADVAKFLEDLIKRGWVYVS
jgi:hypothetical protein